MCLTAMFAACATTKIDDDTLKSIVFELEQTYGGKTRSESFTVPSEKDATDAKGNPTKVFFTWSVSGSPEIYVSKTTDENGRYTVTLPATIDGTITFTLKANLVNEKGKAYTDADKQAYFASMTMTAQAGGSSQGGGNQGGNGDDNQGNEDNTGGGNQGVSKTTTIVMEKQGFTDKAAIEKNITQDGITIEFSVGSGKTKPSYYTNNNGNAVRLYGGNTMTISGKTIIKVEFTFATEYDSNEITVNTGTFTSPTWSGSTTSLVFTIGGTSGNRRITQLVITYTE